MSVVERLGTGSGVSQADTLLRLYFMLNPFTCASFCKVRRERKGVGERERERERECVCEREMGGGGGENVHKRERKGGVDKGGQCRCKRVKEKTFYYMC